MVYAYAPTREEAALAVRACSAPLTDRAQADRECAGLNAYWERLEDEGLAEARRLEVFEIESEAATP